MAAAKKQKSAVGTKHDPPHLHNTVKENVMSDYYEFCECCREKHVLRDLYGFQLCTTCLNKAETKAEDAVGEWVAENKT